MAQSTAKESMSPASHATLAVFAGLMVSLAPLALT